MKKIFLCISLLLLALPLSACSTSFSGSRIGTDTQLLMEYEVFNTTDSQSFVLEKGDVLSVDVESFSGRLDLKVETEERDSVFASENLATWHYEITIPQDGTYTCILTGRRARGSVRIANQSVRAMQSLENTYYEGQNGAAFAMFQKSVFDRLSDDWAMDLPGIESPVWRDGTFAQYYILDSDLTPINSEDLYCCTFSAEDGQYGYMVFSYDGDGIAKVRAAQTPYPYDLRHERAAVKAVLRESGLSLTAPTAARVQLSDGAEGILLKDGSGACSVYRFPD